MSNIAPVLTDEQLWDKTWNERINIFANHRKTPFLLSAIFVDIVRGYYSNPDYLPQHLCVKWDADANKSQVYIDSLAKWNTANPEFRPAILVQTGTTTYSTKAMRADGYYGENTAEGEKFYTRTGTGIVYYTHIASLQAESELLMSATLDYLDSFSSVITDDYCFDSFDVAQSETSTYTKESKERVRCVLTCRYSFTDSWSIKRESLKLKGITIHAGQNLL